MQVQGDITIETEQGLIIDSADVVIREFMRALFKHMPEVSLLQTHCLQFIDEYGDTTFNSLQQKVLVDELNSIVSIAAQSEATEYFGPIIDFISKYQDKVHTYVKFHGD